MFALALLFATWTGVADALGRAGAEMPGGVYKVSFPRSDLDVVAGGVHVKPALALGSWAAFVPSAHGTMVMGDLVLAEDEVDGVLDALQAGGIEQSAVHNHLLGESPRVVYVHFDGHGDAVKLAKALRGALDRTKTPPPSPPAQPRAVLALDDILGAKGKIAGDVVQYSFPRKETIKAHGEVVPPAAGVATAINFQPTNEGRAAATGDFVLLGSEVNRVIRTLRAGGIRVTALHSHMLDEQPRLFFMHFWGEADAAKLAHTLRKALDLTK
ncbi:MAG TPA: DUF1259 domain-containing protein [Thermoanaerobaculia bacterium]|jgi:hypothetical protein